MTRVRGQGGRRIPAPLPPVVTVMGPAAEEKAEPLDRRADKKPGSAASGLLRRSVGRASY